MRQLKVTQQITNRDSQAVEKYFQEVSKKERITPDEEIRLAQKRNAHKPGSKGYQEAVDTLVEANLRFVVSVAKQYQHQWLALSDLINEWNLWLIKGAQRYDETKWFKFISYAVWRIRQSILQAIAEQGRLVRVPQNKIGVGNRIQKAISAFEQEHERHPSDDELAEILDMSITEINNLLAATNRHSSLDAEIAWYEWDGITLWDMIQSESDKISAVFNWDNNGEMSQSVLAFLKASKLPPRENEIVLAYFWFNWLTIEQMESKYDLTKERVRQIKERDIKRLQKRSGAINFLRDDIIVPEIPKKKDEPQRLQETRPLKINTSNYTLHSNSSSNNTENNIVDTLNGNKKKWRPYRRRKAIIKDKDIKTTEEVVSMWESQVNLNHPQEKNTLETMNNSIVIADTKASLVVELEANIETDITNKTVESIWKLSEELGPTPLQVQDEQIITNDTVIADTKELLILQLVPEIKADIPNKTVINNNSIDTLDKLDTISQQLTALSKSIISYRKQSETDMDGNMIANILQQLDTIGKTLEIFQKQNIENQMISLKEKLEKVSQQLDDLHFMIQNKGNYNNNHEWENTTNSEIAIVDNIEETSETLKDEIVDSLWPQNEIVQIEKPTVDTINLEVGWEKKVIYSDEKLNKIFEINYNWSKYLWDQDYEINKRQCIETFMYYSSTTLKSSLGKTYSQETILREAKLRTWILIGQKQFNDYICEFLESIWDL